MKFEDVGDAMRKRAKERKGKTAYLGALLRAVVGQVLRAGQGNQLFLRG